MTAATKKKSSKINILWAIVMIIMICIFAAALCYQYLVHLQLDAARQEVDIQIAEAKAESAALTKQYENQDSPEFIEKVAREKLNMVYPSELVYINSNSEEGKKLLNSIKRTSVKVNTSDKEDDSVSTRVE
ncbi:MAG: septum formation initiator family protein [Clostridia bacterium]|nr:septum formation initiator family protein [Clostridia bacterium]